MPRIALFIALGLLAASLLACGGGGATDVADESFARLIERASSTNGAAQLIDGAVVVLAEATSPDQEMLLRDPRGGYEPRALGFDPATLCVEASGAVRWTGTQARGPELLLQVVEARADGGFAMSGIAPRTVHVGASGRLPANELDLLFRAAWQGDGSAVSLTSAGAGGEPLAGSARLSPADGASVDVFQSTGSVNLTGPISDAGSGRDRVIVVQRASDGDRSWICEIDNPSGHVRTGRFCVLANGDLVLPVWVTGADATMRKDGVRVTTIHGGFNLVHLSASAAVVRIHQPGIVHWISSIERHGAGYMLAGSQQESTTWPSDVGDTTVGGSRDAGTILARFDAQGLMLWNRYHSSATQGRVHFDHLSEGPSGSVLASGSTKGAQTVIDGGNNPDQTIRVPESSYIDGLVVSYDASGDLQWLRAFQGPGEIHAVAAFALENGRVFVHGTTDGAPVTVPNENMPTLQSSDGQSAVWLVHVDPSRP